jgi:hypothetical protein
MKDKRPDSNYNSWQLKTGIKIEMEHRVTKEKAKSIAKDHLDEFPTYYTYLVKMERKLKQQQREHHVNKSVAKKQSRHYKFVNFKW